MFLFAALGVVMTAASASLVGETVSDPVSLIGHIPSPGWVAVAMALIIVATLLTNTAANIVRRPTTSRTSHRNSSAAPAPSGSPVSSAWR